MSEGHIAARGRLRLSGAARRIPCHAGHVPGVQGDYPVRVGQTVRNVADIVEGEKLACRSGNDLSLALVGLSYYVEEPEWKNDLGETWSIDRILSEEMAQPVVTAPEGGFEPPLGLKLRRYAPCKTRPTHRRAIRTGAEICRRFSGVCPATTKH